MSSYIESLWPLRAHPHLEKPEVLQIAIGFQDWKTPSILGEQEIFDHYRTPWPALVRTHPRIAPKIFKNMGFAPWPGVDPGKPARVTIGGINFGVGGYTKHPAEAFAAASCLRNTANQKLYALKGGLPPTLNALYDDPSLAKPYPFKDLIRQQLNSASVRPQSAAYSDISLAISKGLTPPDAINPKTIVSSLSDQIKKAQDSGALL